MPIIGATQSDAPFTHLAPELKEQLRRQQEEFEQLVAQRHEENLLAEDARTRANRKNALYSTGPRTLTGKEVSKLNAVRHGLTGRQILLPSEDAEAYTAHIERYRRDHQPQGERELELTQMLSDTQWRLNRIPGLESAIYAMGRIRYVDMFLDSDEDLRAQLIDLYTYEQSGKQLRNLSLQEGRLRRQYEKDLSELKQLQSERREQEKTKEQTKATVANNTIEKSETDWVRFYDTAETGSKPEQPAQPTSKQTPPLKSKS